MLTIKKNYNQSEMVEQFNCLMVTVVTMGGSALFKVPHTQ